jgi:hypothetical protein
MNIDGSKAALTFEAVYVDDVRRLLSDVPRRQRTRLVNGVAADLAERPDAEAWEQLIAELGEPAIYAATVRSEHGLPAKVGVGAHLRAVRWHTWMAMGLVVVTIAGCATYQRWSSADPGILNSCSGVTPADGVKVEAHEAGGVTEQRISYVDGATVGLGMCLSAAHDVEILDVDLGTLPLSLFQPRRAQAADMYSDPDARAPELTPTEIAASEGWLRVTVEGHLTNCESFSPGVGESFETAEVTYRYRGRTATTPVDLNTTYTFVSPPADKCPRPRQHG